MIGQSAVIGNIVANKINCDAVPTGKDRFHVDSGLIASTIVTVETKLSALMLVNPTIDESF